MLNTTASLSFTDWFDGIFLIYNGLILLFAILIVPVITLVYIYTMKKEKIRRLEVEIPEQIWARSQAEICRLIHASFLLRKYLGSMILLVLVIALGFTIILLLKPMPMPAIPGVAGLDYSKGANFLMLGPFIENYRVHDAVFYHRLIISLTAFQFGFLGAFVYFIGQLARSYFVLDLTPHTFIDATIRMITGSLVALVLSFVLSAGGEGALDDKFLNYLPLVSFFLGFFPTRGLLLLEKLATEFIRILPVTTYKSKDLSGLPGMSYAHEARLIREGYDNAENLSHANAVDLAVRTGFSYCQLQQWIGQAWLLARLRDSYDQFVEATGLGSRHDLKEFAENWPAGETQRPAAFLANGSQELEAKLKSVYAVLP